MEDINKIIGKNLMILRKKAKLTQMELADRFNYSDKSVSKWESGESLPSIEILYELAKFYNTTLDALTVESDMIDTKDSTSKQKDKMFPTKLIITLLAVSAVWLLATVLFVTFKLVFERNVYTLFLWAVPLSCVVLIVFNSIWGKYYYLFPILSVLIWSTLAGVHVQLIQYNLWIIYILGIPLQVAVILWSALFKKPHISKKTKKKKEREEKLKMEEAQKHIKNLKDKKDKKNKNPKTLPTGKADNTTQNNIEQASSPEHKDDDDLEYDFISDSSNK